MPRKPKKRVYARRNEEDIRDILTDYENAPFGEKHLVLREHGVRTSHITAWKAQGFKPY